MFGPRRRVPRGPPTRGAGVPPLYTPPASGGTRSLERGGRPRTPSTGRGRPRTRDPRARAPHTGRTWVFGRDSAYGGGHISGTTDSVKVWVCRAHIKGQVCGPDGRRGDGAVKGEDQDIQGARGAEDGAHLDPREALRARRWIGIAGLERRWNLGIGLGGTGPTPEHPPQRSGRAPTHVGARSGRIGP